jgi:glycosyltransferase involved in cell wall biosynthesis
MRIGEELERRFLLQKEYLGDNKPINKITPMVSVLVTTYQHSKFIRECLDGILMQKTDYPYEIIIGEDESTDGTREICKEYAERHQDKIRLFLRDQNISHYKSGNTSVLFNWYFLFMSVRGKYIFNCEGDDYWTDERKLIKQINILDNNPKYSFCFHNALTINFITKMQYPFLRIMKRKVFKLTDLLRRDWFIPSASLVFRREYLPAILPEWFCNAYSGDLGLELMLAAQGDFIYIDEIMSVYRLFTPSSFSANQRTPYFWLEKKLLLLKEFKHYSKDISRFYLYWGIMKTYKDLIKARTYTRFPLVYELKQEVKKHIHAILS